MDADGPGSPCVLNGKEGLCAIDETQTIRCNTDNGLKPSPAPPTAAPQTPAPPTAAPPTAAPPTPAPPTPAPPTAAPPTAAPPTAAPPTAGPPSSCEDITVSILGDDYPDETSWEIYDDTAGQVEASGFLQGNGGGPEVETICLDDGDYTFTISDTYGDGICCGYGQGEYSVVGSIQGPIASGGQFQAQEATSFSVSTGAPPTAAPTPSVTSETTFAPTSAGGEISYLVCGNPGGTRCGGTISALAPHAESHAFRCCADNQIGPGWIKRDSCDVWAESLQPCEFATHDQATQRCEDAGARLCTKEEYEGKCTRGTGCQYDSQLNWSSTTPDFTQFNVITFDDFEPPNRWGNFINTGSDTWVYTKPVSNGGNDNWRIGTGSLAVRNKNGLGATSTTDLTAAVKNL